MDREELLPGMSVTWLCKTQAGGGYTYILEVPALVVKVGKRRIGIATASPKASRTGLWQPKWVKPDNLKQRADQEGNQ